MPHGSGEKFGARLDIKGPDPLVAHLNFSLDLPPTINVIVMSDQILNPLPHSTTDE